MCIIVRKGKLCWTVLLSPLALRHARDLKAKQTLPGGHVSSTPHTGPKVSESLQQTQPVLKLEPPKGRTTEYRNTVTKMKRRRIAGNMLTHWSMDKINWGNLWSLNWNLKRGRNAIWWNVCFLYMQKSLGNISWVTECKKLKEDQINWNRKFLHTCVFLISKVPF